MCVYIYKSVYINIYMHTHIYAYTYVCIHTHKNKGDVTGKTENNNYGNTHQSSTVNISLFHFK